VAFSVCGRPFEAAEAGKELAIHSPPVQELSPFLEPDRIEQGVASGESAKAKFSP
jgi:hypothetical protein